MKTEKVVVSSKIGNGSVGTIIIRKNSSQKEVRAVLFSCSEAKLLREYIDKMR